MYDNKDKIKVIMYKVTSNGFFFRHSTLKFIITFQTIQNEEVLFMAKQKEVRVHTT